jgi:hypothetical protein
MEEGDNLRNQVNTRVDPCASASAFPQSELREVGPDETAGDVAD